MTSIFLFFIFSLFFSLHLFAGGVSPSVETSLNRNEKVDVIVYLKTKAHLEAANLIIERNAKINFVYQQLLQAAETSQQEVINYLADQNLSYQAFYIENAIAVFGLNQTQVSQLSGLEEVQLIGLNATARLNIIDRVGPKPIRPEGVPKHLKLIQVDKVWSELNVKGEGIVIAGQDTGFYWKHNAIKKQYRGYDSDESKISHDYHWHDAVHAEGRSSSCPANSPKPCDDGSHGTHTMGTMVGDDGSGNQVGVAPGAQWIGCRNMNRGVGSVATYLECFEFLMAPYPAGGNSRVDGRPDLAPHIVNNSWSCPAKEGCTGEEFLEAVRAFKVAGIMVVVAAGNEGPSCGSVGGPPGNYAGELISVGAYNRFTKDIAFFSSVGPSNWNNELAPNIIAPGTLIRSSVPGGIDSYDDKAGTSMASPHVAGVVALLWSARPELIGNIDYTIDILQKTATPMKSKKSCGSFPGQDIPNAVFGYGMINAFAAIQADE